MKKYILLLFILTHLISCKTNQEVSRCFINSNSREKLYIFKNGSYYYEQLSYVIDHMTGYKKYSVGYATIKDSVISFQNKYHYDSCEIKFEEKFDKSLNKRFPDVKLLDIKSMVQLNKGYLKINEKYYKGGAGLIAYDENNIDSIQLIDTLSNIRYPVIYPNDSSSNVFSLQLNIPFQFKSRHITYWYDFTAPLIEQFSDETKPTKLNLDDLELPREMKKFIKKGK